MIFGTYHDSTAVVLYAKFHWDQADIDGLMQEKPNCIAKALELGLFWNEPSISQNINKRIWNLVGRMDTRWSPRDQRVIVENRAHNSNLIYNNYILLDLINQFKPEICTA